jgi:hypothetical protein
MEAYDAILGYDCLAIHSLMNCHWKNRTIEFMDKGKLIKIQGVQPGELTVQPIEVDQLWKCAKGNDIWGFAVVEYVTPAEEETVPESIQLVADQYTNVF